MKLEYYYCHYCGFEGFDVFCGYSRCVANGDLFYCPCCKEENFAEYDDSEGL